MEIKKEKEIIYIYIDLYRFGYVWFGFMVYKPFYVFYAKSS